MVLGNELEEGLPYLPEPGNNYVLLFCHVLRLPPGLFKLAWYIYCYCPSPSSHLPMTFLNTCFTKGVGPRNQAGKS